MKQEYNVDALTDAACAATGFEDFGSATFREGLGILAGDLSMQDRSEDSAEITRLELIHYLSLRLKVTDYVKHHPALVDGAVKRPLFVFGLPRTGTTLVSNLLATDDRRRSLLTWETQDPVPPAEAGALKTDPRALAALAAERKAVDANPELVKFYRKSAIYPTEDVFVMAQDFKTLFWESHGRLPNFRAFMFSTDMHSAYAYHRQYLQVLQSNVTGPWNLKMPSHALWLDTLLDIYPDARLVCTHRDPFVALGSLCSLIGNAHKRYTGHVDHAWLGAQYPDYIAEHARRLMAFRDRAGEDRVYDLHYADMIRDPVTAMRGLYAWAGDDFTPETEAGMRTWLADNPQGKFGKHEYKLAEYGLSEAAVAPLFADYLARYPIAKEG